MAGLIYKPCPSDSQGLLLNGFLHWCPVSLLSQAGRWTGRIWPTQALPFVALIQFYKRGWGSPQGLNRKPQEGTPQAVLGQLEPKGFLSLWPLGAGTGVSLLAPLSSLPSTSLWLADKFWMLREGSRTQHLARLSLPGGSPPCVWRTHLKV